MATTYALNPIKANVGWSMSKTVTGLNDLSHSGNFNWSKAFTNGTGANKLQRLYTAVLTISAGGTTNLDFETTAGTAVNDLFGDAQDFSLIKLIYIELATTTTASQITVGDHAAPINTFFGGTNPTVKIRNGGVFMLGCTDGTGYAVANGNDGIKIVNNDGSNAATVNILVAGE